MNNISNTKGDCPITQLVNVLFLIFWITNFSKFGTTKSYLMSFISAVFWIGLVWQLCSNKYYTASYIVVYGQILFFLIVVPISFALFMGWGHFRSPWDKGTPTVEPTRMETYAFDDDE
tara:strand:- start:503 stop:856 length:354 start_codon:yes stop_codon:yes gene_type:complete